MILLRQVHEAIELRVDWDLAGLVSLSNEHRLVHGHLIIPEVEVIGMSIIRIL